MDEGYITPRQLVIGVFVGTLSAGVFFALLILLPRAKWYREMGGDSPLLIGFIALIVLGLMAFLLRARRRAGEEDE